MSGFRDGIGKEFKKLLDTKRIFPSIGNHDYDMKGSKDGSPFVKFFNLAPGRLLPGNFKVPNYSNEPYYTFVWGNIQWFMLATTSVLGGDGFKKGSEQYEWFDKALKESKKNTNIKFRFAVNHWSPFSTFRYCCRGDCEDNLFEYPMVDNGIDALFTGHEHGYGRYEYTDDNVEYKIKDKNYGKLAGWAGMMAFVTGSGKSSDSRKSDSCKGDVTASESGIVVHSHHDAKPNSQGALKCTATDESVKFEYYNIEGTLVDQVDISANK